MFAGPLGGHHKTVAHSLRHACGLRPTKSEQSPLNASPEHAANRSNGQAPLPAVRSRSPRLGPRVVGVVLGALLGLLVPIILVSYYRSGSQLPVLTHERLEAASARWQTNGPQNYEMQIKIGGRQPGVVQIVVDAGHPVAFTRDGVTPKRRATWDAWTVPNMLDMLDTELAGAANPQTGFGAPPGARVIERAEFDPETGCPIAYERIVLGTALDMSWRVTQFSSLPKPEQPSKSSRRP